METAEQTSTRKSLPLTRRDMQDLAKLRGSSAQRQALSNLTNTEVSETSSESSFLHTVLQAGIRAAQEKADADGYAALGAEVRAKSEERRKVARRRRPSWADDE